MDGGEETARNVTVTDVIARGTEWVSVFDAVGVGGHREAKCRRHRIQTRCRDDGAWAQAPRQATRSRLRDGSVPASDLIGTLRAAYHVVLQRNNGHPDRYLT